MQLLQIELQSAAQGLNLVQLKLIIHGILNMGQAVFGGYGEELLGDFVVSGKVLGHVARGKMKVIIRPLALPSILTLKQAWFKRSVSHWRSQR